MHSTLQQIYKCFETNLGGVDAARMRRRTNDDSARWSVQQIAEHLLMTYDITAQAFETRMQRGSATRATASLRDRVGQFLVITLGQFPKGRKAPAMVVPPEDLPPMTGHEIVVRAEALLMRFDGLAERAEVMFGAERAITHPVLGPMSVESWRRFHLVHGRYHLRQIAALLAADGRAAQSSGGSSGGGTSGSTPSAMGR